MNMKRILLLSTLSIVCTLSGIAQATSNLIIFASEPTPFYAVVNGIRQNSEPKTNVKITGLTNNANSVRIVFSDGVTPDIDKNFYFESMNVEATARIVSTKKGYKLRYFGEVAMGQAAVNEQQTQIIYQTVDAPISTAVATEETVTTTTTTSTTSTGVGTDVNISDVSDGMNENVNMNVSVAGVELNMNVNVTENGMNSNVDMSDNVESTYTSTTTTTTTTSSSGIGVADETLTTTPVSYVPGYSGRTGCIPPLSDVNAIKSAVEDEDFSDDKIMIAKQALKGKCMSVQNIVTISEAFDFEDKKLEFAKFAYDYTYDVDNYYQVNKIFDFSSSKEELNEYVSKR